MALANATGTDIWYNLAPDITDARARQIGSYVRDHLDPALKVYWEYGNEIWNAARLRRLPVCAGHGPGQVPGLRKTAAVYEWDVYRSMQLFAQLREVFAATPARSRYVAAFWAFEASNRPDGTLIPGSFAGRYFGGSSPAAISRQICPPGARHRRPARRHHHRHGGGRLFRQPAAGGGGLTQLPGISGSRPRPSPRWSRCGMNGDMVRVGPGQIGKP